MKRAPKAVPDAVVLAAILLAAFLLGLRLLHVPLERDEGEYAYIAWLMGDGGVPYRDAFNQKPPGTFLAYRAIMGLFGATIEGIHAGARLLTLGTAAIVFLAGRKLFSRGVGFAAAAIFAVASLSPGLLGQSANTETFMALPLAGAALASWRSARPEGGARDALLAGLLVGLAAACKQVAVADGAFFLGWIALGTMRAHGGARDLLARAASFAAGVAAPWVALLAWLGAAGALPYFWSDAVLHNLSYSSAGWSGALANLGTTARYSLIPYLWPLVVLVFIGAWTCVRTPPGERAAGLFVACWLASSFAGASAGGFYGEHYFIQMLAPASLAAAVALDRLTAGVRPPPLRVAAIAGGALLPALLAGHLLFFATPAAYIEAIYTGNPFVESLEVADVVRRNSGPSDQVLVIGSEPQILFYARRRSASRYILTYPLMMNVAGAAERQVDFVRQAVAAKPALVVAVNVPMSHLAGPWTSPHLLDEMNALIARDYEPLHAATSPVGVGPPLVVVKRKASAAR